MKPTVKEIAVFSVLGSMMYVTQVVMSFLPNIHLTGVFIVAITVVYRAKALYPLTVYIAISGFAAGFATWWIPYLYIWHVLWAVSMLLPKKMPAKAEPIVYMCVCALHGFLYGTIYAPAQALLFGLNFKGMLAWIVAGLPFDFIHGVSNFFCGMLIYPITSVLRHIGKYTKA